MAQLYGPDGIRRLADLAGLGAPGLKAESEAAQIAAIKELLDLDTARRRNPWPEMMAERSRLSWKQEFRVGVPMTDKPWCMCPGKE